MTRRSHEPAGYACPFCRLQVGSVDELNQPGDVVAVTDLAYARLSPRWWARNPGTVLVIPRGHHENLYDLPVAVGHAVAELVQRVAAAMRSAYPCDGITTLQNNEPAGGQDVWHLHVHVLARYAGDGLYERSEEQRQSRWVGPAERAPYAELLAAELGATRTFGELARTVRRR